MTSPVCPSYPKGSEVQVGKYFKARDFDCPCDYCGDTYVDPELVAKLDAMRDLRGRPLFVHHGGGYRCDRYQQDLKARGYQTAVGLSTHQVGRAADVSDESSTGQTLEELARKAGFRAVGVGLKWIHVDCRDDKDRRWTYPY